MIKMIFGGIDERLEHNLVRTDAEIEFEIHDAL